MLVVAIGNELRRDDGVAQKVLEQLRLPATVETLQVPQFTPELAACLAGRQLVVLLDAACDASQVVLEPLREPEPASVASTSHHLTPELVVGLARRLYGFEGEVWLLRIPAVDFSPGEGLSPVAKAHVGEAVERMERFLAEWQARQA